MAMLSAMATLVMFIRIPVMPAAPFITYDPKDVLVVMGGFMFGPLAAFTIAGISAAVEMVTVAETGMWGFLMNIVSSSAFAVPAALVYKFRRTLPGAIIGLVIGVVLVVPVMLLMNYLVVPLFMPFVTREAVVPMLTTVFLPFNAIKYSLNAALALLLYKPIVHALVAAGLLRLPEGKGTLNRAVLLTAGIVVLGLITAIIILWLTQGDA